MCGVAGDAGPQPFLPAPGSEKHQTVLVQAPNRNAAATRFFHQRPGGRTETALLGQSLQGCEQYWEVKGLLGVRKLRVGVDSLQAAHPAQVGRQQAVNELQCGSSGQQPHLFVLIGVQDVVDARLRAHAPGLAAGGPVAHLRLEFQGDMLGDVPQPGAGLEAFDEPARTLKAASVLP